MTDDPMALARAMVAENAAHMKATTKRGDWVSTDDGPCLVTGVSDETVSLAYVQHDERLWESVEPMDPDDMDADDWALGPLILGGDPFQRMADAGLWVTSIERGIDGGQWLAWLEWDRPSASPGLSGTGPTAAAAVADALDRIGGDGG